MGLVTSRAGWQCDERYFYQPDTVIANVSIGHINWSGYLMSFRTEVGYNDTAEYGYGESAICRVNFNNGMSGFAQLYIDPYYEYGLGLRTTSDPTDEDYISTNGMPDPVNRDSDIYKYIYSYTCDFSMPGGDVYEYNSYTLDTYHNHRASTYQLDSNIKLTLGLIMFYDVDTNGITISSNVPSIDVPYPYLLTDSDGQTPEEDTDGDVYAYYKTDGNNDQDLIHYLADRMGFFGTIYDDTPEEKLVNNFRMKELITEIKRRLALKQDTTQFAQMSTASSELLGNIYQYVGVTDASYVNGYFYKCVSDGASTPTYSWEHVTLEDLASATKNGLMPAAMYTKLNNITTASATNEGLMPSAMYSTVDSLGLATDADIDALFA